MKKKKTLLLASVLLALPFVCHAQKELFPTGTMWKEVWEEPLKAGLPAAPLDTVNARVFAIGAETIIGGKAYKSVTVDGVPAGCHLREAGNCVWLLTDKYAKEFKLYDFNWGGADSVVTQYLMAKDDETAYELVDDVLQLDGKYTVEQVPQIQFAYQADGSRSLICTIGCVSDRSRNSCLLGYERKQTSPSKYTRVLWLRRNGYEAYRYNGTTVQSSVESIAADRHDDGATYDMQGRRLTTEPAHGMFIRNGKKYVK